MEDVDAHRTALERLPMKPKVLVGAPCSKVPVFDKFYDAFYTMTIPEETDSMRHIGGCVPENLNKIVDHALRTDCTHVFIVEDDSEFERDTLIRLLKHDKPVVAGLCRQRGSPFRPYLYSGIADNGKLEWRPLKDTDPNGLIGPADGLVATGMGGILIRTDVFNKLKRPYFWHTYIGEEYWGQDILFNKSLIAAGVDVWCDLSVTIWHANQCTIGSKKTDSGAWATVFKIDTTAFDAKTQ
jgi:hypothetical protein